MTGFRASALGLAAVVLTTSQSARAGDAATADAVFQAGRRALAQGDYAQAAARFAESQRLEPAPGTLLNLALAEEKLGRLSAAWEHSRSVTAELSPADERYKVAEELHARMSARVPRIVLRGTALPADVRVTLDGLQLSHASFGVPLPVDPGRHRILLDGPGRLAQSREVDARESATLEMTLEAPPRVAFAAGGDTTRTSPLRPAGWASIGVGAAALAAGTVFGLMTLERNDVVERECTGSRCTDAGYRAASQGDTFSAVSTGTFIAGGVLLAAGIVIVLVTRDAGKLGP